MIISVPIDLWGTTTEVLQNLLVLGFGTQKWKTQWMLWMMEIKRNFIISNMVQYAVSQKAWEAVEIIIDDVFFCRYKSKNRIEIASPIITRPFLFSFIYTLLVLYHFAVVQVYCNHFDSWIESESFMIPIVT